MIPERLRADEREIRAAVVTRRFGDLSLRLAELRRNADENLADLPAGDPHRQEIVGWVLTVIRWAHLMTVTQRQVRCGQLTRLPRIGRYLDRADSRRPDVCVDL